MDILKKPFPSEDAIDYQTIIDEKHKALNEYIRKGGNDFTDMYLLYLELKNIENISITIKNTVIRENVLIEKCNISALMIENSNIIERSFMITDSDIGFLHCKKMEFGDRLAVFNTKFHSITIKDVKIENFFCMQNSRINSNVFFRNMIVNGASAQEYEMFKNTDFEDEIYCDNVKFYFNESQEVFYRTVRIVNNVYDDKVLLDKYYHLEMSAKRKQKQLITRVFEYPIDRIFKYGTDWIRVFFLWLIIMIVFAISYYWGNGIKNNDGIIDSVYFSIVTMTTLGYGDMSPITPFFKIITSIESILGSFMWVLFLTVFARRYMR